jgi:hypothetical protein
MSNEPIPMSSFGTFTNECASNFCKDKDGFNLWFTLLNDCFYHSNDSVEVDENRMLTNYTLHSPLFTALVCSGVGFVCFMMSYIITKRFCCKMVKKIHHEIKD